MNENENENSNNENNTLVQPVPQNERQKVDEIFGKT